MLKNAIVLFLICMSGYISYSQPSAIPLYEGVIPNSLPAKDKERTDYNSDHILVISKVSHPTLTVFLPSAEKANGYAVIICPGGGYTNLAFDYEGTEVARRFVESGIAAFVLKYRIPDDSSMLNKEIGPLQDAQRAIQMVRMRAKEWNVDPDKIGIMGFSAGGHVAATAGTHFEKNYISNPNHISLRPDYLILIYPVVSFLSPNAHLGSEHNLLGPNPSIEKIKEYSNELCITDHTPPAFLVHAKDDDAVPVANTLLFAESLKKHHISEEVYLYEKGGHGFSMNNHTSTIQWMDLCIQWIQRLHL